MLVMRGFKYAVIVGLSLENHNAPIIMFLLLNLLERDIIESVIL